MKASDISPTFCVVPWHHMATNSTGAYRVCCNAIHGKNLIRDNNDKPLYVNKVPAEQAWNAPTYKKIREQMLKGERPEMCTRCFREEDSGVESARQHWNKQGPPENPQPEAPMEMRYIDLRLGNLCNLKCRMCNPYSSSQWVDEWNKVSSGEEFKPLDENEKKRLRTLDWPRSVETWQNLEKVLQSVEEIYLTGGEPFLSLEQSHLLQKVIDEGRSSEIILRYNTNLTALPEKIISLWKHFKLIRVNISFDAYGPLNNYIRYPSKWSSLEENMHSLIELKKQGLPLELSIHTTVQMYNVTRLPEIFDFFQNKFDTTPFTNILNHPSILNIRVLPDQLRDETIEKLNSLEQYQPIRDVIHYLKNQSWHQKHWPQFVRYTKQLDVARKENFLDICPEFKNYFS